MKKPSLLDRLTGGAEQDFDDLFDDEEREVPPPPQHPLEAHGNRPALRNSGQTEWTEPEEHEELSIDVYQTENYVVIKALIAGVVPNNLDIALTRDMVTIKGTREDEKESTEDGYFQRELYWGSFSRTILLPEEVDVEAAEATEKHGVLMIRLPKVNKSKQTKLKVKSR